MPLDREHITPQTRMMIPAYLATLIPSGLNYATTPRADLTRSPTFRAVDHYVPMPVWGWAFLTIAALIVVSIIVRRRSWCRFALLLAGVSWVVWFIAFAAATFAPGVPWSVWTFTIIPTFAFFATQKSLAQPARRRYREVPSDDD